MLKILVTPTIQVSDLKGLSRNREAFLRNALVGRLSEDLWTLHWLGTGKRIGVTDDSCWEFTGVTTRRNGDPFNKAGPCYLHRPASRQIRKKQLHRR
ncbi:hypothetical protein [Sinorhizobium psoraleae]|uniref:hypothetical protein n=1 Tax=Sinorhizobium psoraleae TaxID=520838 RepID=UPI0015685440|nr:hypothetical protein [Sinorhizobium psoraleae]